MKRTIYVRLFGMILLGALASLATAQSQDSQSLGDYARAARKDKKTEAAKKFDNDNLPTDDKLSVVGNAPAEPDSTQAAAQTTAGTDQKPGESAAKATGKPGESADDRQKMYSEWQKKIAAQKDQIDLLTRELDVAQREYKLRAAAMYADAGNRLRNAGTWDKEDAQYKQQIDQKQKALDAAKQQMEDLQEQARKGGVPSSMRE